MRLSRYECKGAIAGDGHEQDGYLFDAGRRKAVGRGRLPARLGVMAAAGDGEVGLGERG